MTFKSILASATIAALFAAPLSAASVGWSEGQRAQVAGTQVVTPVDASNTPPGFFLGSIRGNETIDLHGRIVRAEDFFTFEAKRNFRVDFIFGGYTLEAGGFVADSGLTAIPVGSPGASVDFFLTSNGVVTPSAGNSYNTDITSGPSLIFGPSMAAGSYELEIDGLNFEDGLYDIRITSLAQVPLPAGGLLLMTALGGLAVARRKKT